MSCPSLGKITWTIFNFDFAYLKHSVVSVYSSLFIELEYVSNILSHHELSSELDCDVTNDYENPNQLVKIHLFGCDRQSKVFCQILFILKSRNFKIFCSFVFKRSTGAAILGYGAAKS